MGSKRVPASEQTGERIDELLAGARLVPREGPFSPSSTGSRLVLPPCGQSTVRGPCGHLLHGNRHRFSSFSRFSSI